MLPNDDDKDTIERGKRRLTPHDLLPRLKRLEVVAHDLSLCVHVNVDGESPEFFANRLWRKSRKETEALLEGGALLSLEHGDDFSRLAVLTDPLQTNALPSWRVADIVAAALEAFGPDASTSEQHSNKTNKAA